MIPLPIRLTLDPSAVVVTQCSVDAVDETVAGLDATYGTVSPTSAANASRKFKFFYNYSVTPTQNSHTHTLA